MYVCIVKTLSDTSSSNISPLQLMSQILTTRHNAFRHSQEARDISTLKLYAEYMWHAESCSDVVLKTWVLVSRLKCWSLGLEGASRGLGCFSLDYITGRMQCRHCVQCSIVHHVCTVSVSSLKSHCRCLPRASFSSALNYCVKNTWFECMMWKSLEYSVFLCSCTCRCRTFGYSVLRSKHAEDFICTATSLVPLSMPFNNFCSV